MAAAMALRGMLLALAIAAVVACGGSEPAPIPGVTSVTATRDRDANGFPGLTSTVEIRFDRALEFADRTVPFASLFELELPDLLGDEGATVRVLLRDAEEPEEGGRVITLQIDRLVPDGSAIRIANKAFRKDEPGDIEAAVVGDLAPIEALLASTAFEVTDPAIVDGTRELTPSEADRDPAAQRAALEAHLDGRGQDAETRERALATFDSIPETLVPSPKLRAALAALTGTFAEPAIAYLLTAENCTGRPVAAIAFEQPQGSLFAQVTHDGSGARVVSFAPALEAARIEHLMPLLAHEAIHCDTEPGLWEEIAATAFDSYFYVLLAATFPEIVDDGTLLVRDLNVDAIALINSGAALPESVGILPSPGVTAVLPGTTSEFGSFAELVAAAYGGIGEETPLEPLAQVYAAQLAAQAGMEEGAAFDLLYLDELLGRAINPNVQLGAMESFRLAAFER